jgi:hypothetical protein
MTPTRQPSDFFLFDLPPAPTEAGAGDLVVFSAAATIDVDLLIGALRRHLERAMPPGRVLLLGPQPAAEQIMGAATGERLMAALPEFTRWTDTPPVIPLVFTGERELRDPSGNLPEANESGFADNLVREGLRWIFRERNGMLRTGPGFHYVNPSGRHTKGFIRTGNVLLHSAEVAFIAMGILKWWPPGLRRIFVDTASISSVAYALISLREIFEPNLRPPTIDSFSSYGGVHEFDFIADRALCLISATTSGGLEGEILQSGYLAAERIVTLFYCGPPPRSGAHVLCDLTAREGLPGEPEPISHDRAEECEMCRRGSATIRISGDQFLPADPDVSDLVLSAAHAPQWLTEFLRAVAGQKILRCHGGSPGDSGRVREIYIQLQDALRRPNAGFASTLERQLKTTVPASLAKIIYVDHPSSQALADAVAEHFAEVSGRELPSDFVLSAKQVLSREVSLKDVRGPVIVIAGAMSTGRTLLGISQFLRNVVEVDSIVYLVGVSRAASRSEWERVHSNLTYGPRPGAHPFVSIASAFLAGEHGVERSPWESEGRFLGEVRKLLERRSEGNGEVDTSAIEAIDARRELLNAAAASGGEGLIDDLFLPRVHRGELSFEDPHRLEMRPGFTYWRGLPENVYASASQADVYVTIVAILHRLRSTEADEAALFQHEHNRTVLSPANFARFNDGVIQSALLRAARPRELDYAHDATLSAQMRDMVRRFIEHMGEDEGEAAPEFLLAVARGQLNLTRDDRKNISDYIAEIPDLPPLMQALHGWLKTQCTAESDSSEQNAALSPL